MNFEPALDVDSAATDLQDIPERRELAGWGVVGIQAADQVDDLAAVECNQRAGRPFHEGHGAGVDGVD